MLAYLSIPLISFISAFLAIYIMAPVALRFGFTDSPGGHKLHNRAVPPIGGLALYAVLAVCTLSMNAVSEDYYFLLATGLLVLVGAVDDKIGLRVRSRILTEICASLIMAYGAGITLTHFGNLLGFGIWYLPWWFGISCTVIAVFGTINAWNMVDGIDGLAATMAIFSLTTLLLITVDHEALPVSAAALLGGLLAFLVFNFSNGKYLPKVFLGDAGSKLIGFSLVWFMIRDTQGEGLEFKPATALYVMGLPIMDMTSTVLSRIKRHKSPFSADRTHLHHVCMSLGLSRYQSYLAIITLALVLHAIGLVLHRFQVVGYIQFGLYGLLFGFYHIGLSRIKKALERSGQLSFGSSV